MLISLSCVCLMDAVADVCRESISDQGLKIVITGPTSEDARSVITNRDGHTLVLYNSDASAAIEDSANWPEAKPGQQRQQPRTTANRPRRRNPRSDAGVIADWVYDISATGLDEDEELLVCMYGQKRYVNWRGSNAQMSHELALGRLME